LVEIISIEYSSGHKVEPLQYPSLDELMNEYFI